MKTYTRHSIAGWDVYTDDETGRVHHLVDPDSNDPRALYPYIPAAGDFVGFHTKSFLRFIAFLCVLPYHGCNEIQ